MLAVLVAVAVAVALCHRNSGVLEGAGSPLLVRERVIGFDFVPINVLIVHRAVTFFRQRVLGQELIGRHLGFCGWLGVWLYQCHS